ncbi:MAG: hypothetical protein Q7R56_03575 [Nanoarchaeota archaeon]|nr:hypothetical protein [Nanoarchaeota archaeon]
MNNKGEVHWYLIGFILAVIVLGVMAVSFYKNTNKTRPITEGTTNSLLEQYKNLDLKQLTPDLQTQLKNSGKEGEALILLAEAKQLYADAKTTEDLGNRKILLTQAIQKTQQAIDLQGLKETDTNYNNQPAVQLLKEIRDSLQASTLDETIAKLKTIDQFKTFVKENPNIQGSIAIAEFLYAAQQSITVQEEITDYEKIIQQTNDQKEKTYGSFALGYLYKKIAETKGFPEKLQLTKEQAYQKSQNYLRSITYPTTTIDKILAANSRLLEANIVYMSNQQDALQAYQLLLKDHSYSNLQGDFIIKERIIMEQNIKNLNPTLYPSFTITLTMTGTLEDNDDRMVNLPEPLFPQQQTLLNNYRREAYPTSGEKIVFIIDKAKIKEKLGKEVHGIRSTSEFAFTLYISEGLLHNSLCQLTTRPIPVYMKNNDPNLGWPTGTFGTDTFVPPFDETLDPEDRTLIGVCKGNDNTIYARLISYGLSAQYDDTGQDSIKLLLELPPWKEQS